jgi:DNA primase
LARFSEQFVQQVAQATDIVDLVGQYVALKKRGHEFIGLCPFHDDKHPSMNVSPNKQIFKCFACGAGGGVFKFMELHDRLSFPEAVRALAERANIPKPREFDPVPVQAGMSKQDLLRVTAFAAEFFQQQLHSPGGRETLEYAHSRGLTDETIKRFGIGFAPDFWDMLLSAARREGFAEAQLLAAGLVVKRENGEGCYDRFRNRLIFPILDVTNNVIAFGGRALAANERAKYLNSPESTLYDKSSQLYALNWAREAISANGQAVVVEGYMDAVIPHQAGVNNVVANLGTALTDRQVRLLSRYAKEVVLIYDADTAGQLAAERSLEMFLVQQLHVRVATIPEGKDPCDYTLAAGGKAMKALIASAPDALEYAWGRRAAQLEQAGGNLARRREIVEEFLRLVASCSAFGAIDDVRRGQLAQHIAHLLNLSASEVQGELRRMSRTIPRANLPSDAPVRAAAHEGETPSPQATGHLAQRNVLEVLLNRPDLFDGVMEKLDASDFGTGDYASIADEIWRRGAAGLLATEELVACEAMAPLGGVLADLIATGQRRGNHEQTLAGAVEFLLYQRNRQQMQDQKSEGYTDDMLRQLDQSLKKADARRRPKIT